MLGATIPDPLNSDSVKSGYHVAWTCDWPTCISRFDVLGNGSHRVLLYSNEPLSCWCMTNRGSENLMANAAVKAGPIAKCRPFRIRKLGWTRLCLFPQINCYGLRLLLSSNPRTARSRNEPRFSILQSCSSTGTHMMRRLTDPNIIHSMLILDWLVW
jgi:hypothetical protein